MPITNLDDSKKLDNGHKRAIFLTCKVENRNIFF